MSSVLKKVLQLILVISPEMSPPVAERDAWSASAPLR